MEIKNQFVLKIAFLLCLIFGACVSPKENHSVTDSETIKSEDCFVKEELVSSDLERFKFQFENLTVEMIFHNSDSANVLQINSLGYPLHIQIDSPRINFWYYACGEKALFLIEGDDYYGSVFFAYYFMNEKLYYLGDFTIEQPNVEDEGVFEKDFQISQTENQFEIISFLNGNVYDTEVFKEMRAIQRN